ncbi:hypothetical protein [Halomonas sp. Y3]|uniref:hypothetical protein n=1 Tax=Halomonas sp. Y3 TaxID=2956797 RepID=UPI00209CEDFB|nr:hypothetical protein [Halomonas sp. Y3]
MLNLPQGSPIHAEIERQHRQHIIRRLARAVAQDLQLRLEEPTLVLAPRLGQPITLGNRDALQQWVTDTLVELDLPMDSDALEPLCEQLNRILSEVH